MIDTVVTEFRTVEQAFTSTNKFVYDRLSAINLQRAGTEYPLIVLEATLVQVRGNGELSLNKLYLPRRKVYELNLFAFDEYKLDEKDSTALEVKQAAIELILDQYVAELLRRTLPTTLRGFQIIDFENMQGILAHDVHNDKIVQANYRIRIMLDTQCNVGTFNY